MRATLLGTGCPAVDPKRCGAATLIANAEASILIDCGSGTTQRLVEAGTRGADMDALLLTHLHSDHLVDLYQLIVSGWHQGRDRPWHIYGPAPVIAHVKAVMALWEDERSQRIAFEQRPSATGLSVETHEIIGGSTVTIGGIEIEVVAVDHAPVTPALGFVFRSQHRTIVHSGDTRRCPALIEAGFGADLLIHEVYLHREMTPIPGIRDQATIDATASYHTLSSEVGGVATAMQAKALALTHFVPPAFDRRALLVEVAETYSGPVFVGEDLMTFDLERGDVSWRDLHARLLAPAQQTDST